MPLQSRCESGRRLVVLAVALLLAAIPSSGAVLAQGPPGDEIIPVSSPALDSDRGTGLALVNGDREFVERKEEGEFVARPVFDREIANLYYAVRDGDTGDWLTEMFRVRADGKRRSDGW